MKPNKMPWSRGDVLSLIGIIFGGILTIVGIWISFYLAEQETTVRDFGILVRSSKSQIDTLTQLNKVLARQMLILDSSLVLNREIQEVSSKNLQFEMSIEKSEMRNICKKIMRQCSVVFADSGSGRPCENAKAVLESLDIIEKGLRRGAINRWLLTDESLADDWSMSYLLISMERNFINMDDKMYITEEGDSIAISGQGCKEASASWLDFTKNIKNLVRRTGKYGGFNSSGSYTIINPE